MIEGMKFSSPLSFGEIKMINDILFAIGYLGLGLMRDKDIMTTDKFLIILMSQIECLSNDSRKIVSNGQ